MATSALRRDEGVGLALAVAAHVALVAFLVWRPLGRPVLPPPERMTVTISDEVGLTSTSPEPAAQAAPDVGPEIGEPAPPEPMAQPEPPQPIARPEPPAPQPKPQPPKLQPKPAPRAAPPPKPVVRPAPPPPRPAPRAALAPAPKPAQARPQARPAATPPRKAGASSFSDAFKTGVPGAQASGQSRNPPATAAGPEVQASLRSAVSRQLKPHWTAPQGADAELLVTLVRFRLARDGSLVGQPQVVSQSGETPANSAQKARHAEQAIRAVRLAAPFDLPDEYYSAWQTVTSRFDRRLSQ